jgi:predicted RNA-binding Zn-ribbon protein involved in translation (DUF1610 family)
MTGEAAGSGRAEVRVSTSGFDFTCPGCGDHITEDDPVWTVPVSELVQWPVCEDCGRFWLRHREGLQG